MRAVLPRRYRPEHKARPGRIMRRTAVLEDPESERSIADDLAELEAQDAERERRDADDPHLTTQWPAIADDEPRWVPEEGSHPYPPSDPREEAARLLTTPETPTMADMRRLCAALKAWEPPADADLVSFQAPEKAVIARLGGMPHRTVTDSGRPVLMLGAWAAREGASFAVGGMSDEWLDALIVAAEEEREARRAARMPSFTPHPAPEATQVIPNGVPDGARPAEDVPVTENAANGLGYPRAAA